MAPNLSRFEKEERQRRIDRLDKLEGIIGDHYENGDEETNIIDALADLMLLAKRRGLEWDETIVPMAAIHFNAEKETIPNV